MKNKNILVKVLKIVYLLILQKTFFIYWFYFLINLIKLKYRKIIYFVLNYFDIWINFID